MAEMGADVQRVEFKQRPDPMRKTAPRFYSNLNRRKSDIVLDLSAPDDRAHLRAAVLKSDIVITSARPRAFEMLDLTPISVFAAKPDLVWCAINGYGWTGVDASRVAFGDDAAAAGGLLRWTANGVPNFVGDALSDPVTGMAAAIGCLNGLIAGGGMIVDASLARCAAGAAVISGLREGA